ncbi:hypothetical protein CRE_27170 [Caenorhabditis remanei]|uniref:DNA2/NAM7 helicase-like C-terminal domain-containing protein n=1 Tax=Caenorhabditis remanei TaxID=31234 RepID=E3LNV1_CAERE|nr:hypothetical protein CRE_27170 [Caenorhabditis remanei]
MVTTENGRVRMPFPEGSVSINLFDSELNRNRLTRFYLDVPKKGERFKRIPKTEVQEELRNYTHAEAVFFAASSWNWQRNSNPRLSRREGEGIPTFRNQTGNRAYYRVFKEKENKYILIACHANVHGFHRGDLRFVEVNDKTITRGIETCSIIGKLFPGDVVAVSELSKKSDVPLNPPGIFKVHPDANCIWEVSRMTILSRRRDEAVNFAILENALAIVEGHVEAMNVMEDVRNNPLQMDTMYSGCAFVPEKMEISFTEDFHRKYMNPLTAILSDLPSYSNSLGTIHTYFYEENQTRLFEIGVKAFHPETYLSKPSESEKIVEKCVRMGASAAQIVSTGRFDGRGFPVRDMRRTGPIVRFTIANPRIQPTESRWTNNQRIKLEGRDGKFDAIIETVVLDESRRKIWIAARIPRNTPNSITFRNDVWIVHQQPYPAIPKFENGFFKDMHKNSNGRLVIETLYGGPIIIINNRVNVDACYIFPSDPEVVLNEYQNYYVSMILADIPMVLGNSPFGCGKSMTIVTAAIEVHKRNSRHNGHGKQKQQLLVTQSNNAGVSLIDIALKIPDEDIKFLRYVSESNWNLLPESSRTDLDMPQLMEEVFIGWATHTLARVQQLNELTIEMKRAMVRKIIQKYLPSQDLVGEARRIYENMIDSDRTTEPSPRTLRQAFFLLYQPDIIVTTADSLQGLLSCSVVDPRSISNLQIDEASQLPEHTLIHLLHTFPNAGFGLVGDIKQLPPHCENQLIGRLKDYGIGNTMERSLQCSMFPQSILRYVYRCHPVTTRILSDLFYNGRLISGVDENDRNEFLRMRRDIWPNPKFPIVVLNHTKGGHRVGTSVANEHEKLHVLRIIEYLTEETNGYKLNASDVGVISFYRAQTSLLTEAFRGTGIKCGTIDAFQGSEKEVVIVCCTSDKLSPFMKLGNRFNVAMSRARQATIVIGNARQLRTAEYWSDIVQMARNKCCLKEVSEFGRYQNGRQNQLDGDESTSDDENNSDMDDDDDSGGHDSEDDGIDDESNTNETDDDEYDDTDDSDDFNENESRNKNDSIIQARRNKILSGVCQNQNNKENSPPLQGTSRTAKRRDQRRRAQVRKEKQESQNQSLVLQDQQKRRNRPSKKQRERQRNRQNKEQEVDKKLANIILEPSTTETARPQTENRDSVVPGKRRKPQVKKDNQNSARRESTCLSNNNRNESGKRIRKNATGNEIVCKQIE